MQELLTLTQTEFTLLAVICFCAGLVRGFTGFALSAIVMASAALILSPLALIPICWWLELVASAIMVRGGWKDADKGAAVTLWLGSAIAVPIIFIQNITPMLDFLLIKKNIIKLPMRSSHQEGPWPFCHLLVFRRKALPLFFQLKMK